MKPTLFTACWVGLLALPVCAQVPPRIGGGAPGNPPLTSSGGFGGFGRQGNSVPGTALPTAPAPPLGLAVLDDKGAIQSLCPLQRTDVVSDIAGNVARVVVRQRFSNPSKEPIEALYTFPLPHDGAVDGMVFRIGERQIVGQIKKRAEAAQVYQEAKAAGRNAALLDQERPNIFTQRVANIMPGQKIQVEISFVQPITYRAGKYEWEFPTVVGPRFTGTGIVPDADKITPPITPEGQRAGHDLTMQVQLRSPLPLGEVSSAVHPIVVKKQGENSALISLKDGATLPNKDFVLRFAPRDNALQTGLITGGVNNGNGFFQLVLQPPAAAPKAQIAPKEMVFVIDQTGSQSGTPIEKAKETMRYCIQNLNPGDTFQLLGFNTDVFPCFTAPVEATPANIQKALDYLKPLEGNGGTDVLKATEYALKIPNDPNRPRIVCFMTDGYVGNEAQIIDYVRDHRGQVRMFPFGVGNSVNRYLIDGMAREGRGVPEYALLNEDGQKLAQRFYKRVANPLLLDVKVDWNGLPVSDVFPKVIPDVFENAPVVLTGRFNGAQNGEVILRGNAAGKPWEQRIRVNFPQKAKEGGEGLPSLWARQKIEDLSNRSTQNAASGETAQDLAEQITNVALEFRLMSPYTSFVAVEPQVVNIGGQQKTVDVPVEMPDGVSYEGIFGESGGRGGGFGTSLGVSHATGAASYIGNGAGRGFIGGGFGGSANGMFVTGGVPIIQRSSVQQNINGVPLAPPVAAYVLPPASGQTKPSAPTVPLEGGIVEAYPPAPVTPLTPEQVEATKKEQQIANNRLSKMVPALQQLLERYAKENKDDELKVAGLPEVSNGRVTLQLWLNALDSEGKKTLIEALKKLGWKQDAVLQPDKLVLGSIEVEKFDELAALVGVRMVDVPKFTK